ncbi:endonuclease VII domain-containing protein [Amycolatopsis sp. NPDC059027]|uniref:endonuclease VII domain-containing protein n=1 Tax=Amycolatopsis sp. NPDC059027 TaxID=3346709 RepID=UPI00366FC3DD
MTVCKDCISEGVKTRRPAPHPGPRCSTHLRARKLALRARSRAQYVERTYSITEAQYQALYEAQGGVCALCRRAKGTGRKRLAVDHDHKCCPGPVSCGECVRGLLCTSCNKGVLGHARDEVEFFERGIEYLTNPPARRVLN